MVYTVKYKRKNDWFWKKCKVIGHGACASGKLILDLENGGLREIPSIDELYIEVCPKWKLTEKAKANKEAGQKVID